MEEVFGLERITSEIEPSTISVTYTVLIYKSINKPTNGRRIHRSVHAPGVVCDWGWIRSNGGWHDDLTLDPDCDVGNNIPFWTNAPCGLLAKVTSDGEVSVVHGADTDWSRSAI